MRTLLVPLVLICVAILVIAYLLLSPTSMGDYRWVTVALPISLLLAREFFDYLPAAKLPRLPDYFELVTDEDEDEEEDAEDTEDELDAQAEEGPLLAGLWTGTVYIWPDRPEHAATIMPLCLTFVPDADGPQVLTSQTGAQRERIIGAEVLEYDADRGHLDLQLLVAERDQLQTFKARLTRKGKSFVPEDNTDPVTVELRPARLQPLPHPPPAAGIPLSSIGRVLR